MQRPDALTWCAVLEDEYEALYGVPPLDADAPADPAARLDALHARLHLRRPAALCLSGGGIRSATFGLGVLQALAHVGVLGTFDYLSTVSGGGYVGGWFTTWLHRQGRATVLRALDPDRARAGPSDTTGGSPLDRLRSTCRYLAPQGGIVSADMWTLVATMARNLFLNWLVLLPLLAAALLVPRAYYATVHALEQNVMLPLGQPCLPIDAAPLWLLLIASAGFAVPTGYIVMNFVGRGSRWSQGRFLSLVVVPAVVGSVALTLFWSAFQCGLDAGASLFLTSVIPAAAWVLVGAAVRPTPRALVPAIAAGIVTALLLVWVTFLDAGDPRRIAVAAGVPVLLLAAAAANQILGRRDVNRDGDSPRINAGVRTVAAALVAGPLFGGGTYWFAHHYFWFGNALDESYAAFAVPGLLALAILTMTLFVGVASRELTDDVLEWWSRCAAWLAIAAALWLAAAVLVFYLADAIGAAVAAAREALSLERRTFSALVAVVVPLLSSLAAIVTRETAPAGEPSTLRRLVQGVTMPVIVVVLLATAAWGDVLALEALEYHAAGVHARGAGLSEVLLLGGSLLLFGLLTSRFVPVNRFSLHGMYRQRLMRTFLGASHQHRQPDAFTGFDPRDDIRVHELRDVRPLHVVNATLNDVASTGVGRNETRAHAFTFTPLHVGSPVLGYRAASEYGSDGGGRATGVSLAMALAVSGAAVSSAMGMRSSKALAFLMTLANARLGLWFGNPTDPVTWQRSEPPLGVGPLVREMLGLATDRNPYVYLSDGGHFENLGLWSMVARRCGVIIVSDAGCDPKYTFDDLSNAVRRIRLDLGIPIEFDSLDISREGHGRTNSHGAIGRIRYRAVDGDQAPDGVLLYVKATLSGDESVDVRNFAGLYPAFPHDSTANQFFDEARFESYRALGYHSIMSLAPALTDGDAWTLCRVAAEALERGPLGGAPAAAGG